MAPRTVDKAVAASAPMRRYFSVAPNVTQVDASLPLQPSQRSAISLNLDESSSTEEGVGEGGERDSSGDEDAAREAEEEEEEGEASSTASSFGLYEDNDVDVTKFARALAAGFAADSADKEVDLLDSYSNVSTASTVSKPSSTGGASARATSAAASPPKRAPRRAAAPPVAPREELEVEIERSEGGSRGSRASSHASSSSSSKRSQPPAAPSPQSPRARLSKKQALFYTMLAHQVVELSQRMSRLKQLLHMITGDSDYEADFDADDEAHIVEAIQSTEDELRAAYEQVPPELGMRFKLECTLKRRETLIERAVLGNKLDPDEDKDVFHFFVSKQVKLMELLQRAS